MDHAADDLEFHQEASRILDRNPVNGATSAAECLRIIRELARLYESKRRKLPERLQQVIDEYGRA